MAKARPIPLLVIDGMPIALGAVIHHMTLRTLTISKYTEVIPFDIILIEGYNIILRMLWL
jgi:hypothetical protein